MSSATKTSPDIEFGVHLKYGQDYEDPSNKIPVLLWDTVFKNKSKTKAYTISVWNLNLGIESISPLKNVKKLPTNSGLGMPAPPKREQAVTLKPGGIHRIKNWYWARSDLPWTNIKRTEAYLLKKEGLFDLRFCVDLRDDKEVFTAMGFKTSEFTVAHLCAKPVKLDFKFLAKED